MSEWWDTPFLVCIGLSILVLVLRPTLVPIEKLCSFFGIGRVDASVAEAVLLGTAGLFGLVFNQAAGHIWAETYAAGHLALGLGTGLGLGLAVAWLAGKLAPDAEPADAGLESMEL